MCVAQGQVCQATLSDVAQNGAQVQVRAEGGGWRAEGGVLGSLEGFEFTFFFFFKRKHFFPWFI